MEKIQDGIKTVVLHDKANDVLNEVTAKLLEDVCGLFGHDITVEDVDWQVVFDLKEQIIDHCEMLGLKIER